MRISGIVPARFLTIVAHVIILIILFWAKDDNIKQCLPTTYTQSEYDSKDTEMIIGLSVGLGLMLIELIGFIGGISMFMPFQSMLSVSAHCGACVSLAYFILWEMPCHRYWYIFGFSTAFPALTEIITFIQIVCLRNGQL